MRLKKISFTIPWNLFLITLGALVYSIGIKGIVVHHNFIPGGVFGAALLLTDRIGFMSPSTCYFFLNVPLFMVGYFFVGRRFFLYSLYGMLVITAGTELITLNFHVTEQIYAAIAGGLICGTGNGIIFRSLGSGGGLDIVAVALYSRFNIGIGKVYLAFNVILFGLVASLYNSDILVASIILAFITSVSLDRVLALFNQRKIVYVISDYSQKIAEALRTELSQGATFIKGQGAFSGKDKLVLMAITNNIQLKKMESIIFSMDEHALFIVEDSFNVIGSNLGKRKIY